MPIRPLPLFLERSLTLPDPKPWTETLSWLLSRTGSAPVKRDGRDFWAFLRSPPLPPTISSNVVGRPADIPFVGVVGLPDGEEVFESVLRNCAGIDIRT